MQFTHVLFFAYTIAIAAVGVHAADSSSSSVQTSSAPSASATNPPSSSSGSATSAPASSASGNTTASAPPAKNSTNHALPMASFERTLLYVAGGAMLGAVTVL
ncbi:hypothetical protein C2E23DRAFT_884001 [Lenzites betulinus]|nr:hypothetical protein C2E23DRAFT_884001 [Lenzites betulinus]